jgi:hypothetical protein
MARIHDMRGGKDYDASFAHRMKGQGAWAQLLRQRFNNAVRRLGLNERQRGILDVSQFRCPSPRDEPDPQLSLF